MKSNFAYLFDLSEKNNTERNNKLCPIAVFEPININRFIPRCASWLGMALNLYFLKLRNQYCVIFEFINRHWELIPKFCRLDKE